MSFLFLSVDDDFNCAELTNKDDYTLDMLEAPKERPPQCVAADPDNELCQLVGDWTLRLEGIGSRHIYKHYSEHCSGVPPEYKREEGC